MTRCLVLTLLLVVALQLVLLTKLHRLLAARVKVAMRKKTTTAM